MGYKEPNIVSCFSLLAVMAISGCDFSEECFTSAGGGGDVCATENKIGRAHV